MISSNVQQMIPQIQTYFSSKPVDKAWLFGSCSRGEETASSDVDILIKLSDGARISLLKYAGFVCDLEDILHRNVDLVEEGQLLPFAVESAERDKIKIYERGN